nr:hypothetical protein 220p1_00044 [Serratia entomophila]
MNICFHCQLKRRYFVKKINPSQHVNSGRKCGRVSCRLQPHGPEWFGCLRAFLSQGKMGAMKNMLFNVGPLLPNGNGPAYSASPRR